MGFFGWIIRLIEEYYQIILLGILKTIFLALTGTIIGLCIAFLFTLIRVNDIKMKRGFKKGLGIILNKFVDIYVAVIRGTPMIVQAVIFYYLFKQYLNINWSPLIAGLFTVSINTTAYLTEVLRGGIDSVDKGQIEGARSIGLSNFGSYRFIIFPQALKNSMASIGNEFIVNIKDTSVLSVIGVIELYNSCIVAGSKYYKAVESMIIAAVIYLILTFTTSKLLRLLERKIGAPVKGIVSSN